MSEAAPQAPVYSEFSDDPDFEELLEMFVDTIAERKDLLQQQFSSGNLPDIRVTAHQLKGAGGGYGFNDLTTLAADLEEACKENNIDRVGQTLDVVLEYMGRIKV